MYFGLKEEQLDRFLGWQGQGLAEFQGGAFSGEQASVAGINAPFWVQLTAIDGTNTYYAWTEQQFDGGIATPAFVPLPSGRFGTVTQNPAREPNGVVLTTPTFVRLQRMYYDPTLDWVYGIVSESAVPSTGVTQNLSGFTFSGLHPTQSIPSGTLTTLTDWAAATSGDWTCDGTNFTVNPSENGINYVFSVVLQWAANSTGSRHGVLVGNTGNLVGQSWRAPTIPSDFHWMSFSIPLLGGSSVGGFHVAVMQDSGGNLNIGQCVARMYGVR